MSEIRPTTPRRRAPSFRPAFTLSLLYVVIFFFVYALLMVLPQLLDLLSSMPPGPEQEQAAARVARESTHPLAAFLLSLATTALGVHFQLLPGMRAR
jgi:hypothetical protein